MGPKIVGKVGSRYDGRGLGGTLIRGLEFFPRFLVKLPPLPNLYIRPSERHGKLQTLLPLGYFDVLKEEFLNALSGNRQENVICT